MQLPLFNLWYHTFLSVGPLFLDFLSDPALDHSPKFAEHFHVHDKVHGADDILEGVADLALVLENRQEMETFVVVLDSGDEVF